MRRHGERMSSNEAGWVRAAASGDMAEGEVIGVAVAAATSRSTISTANSSRRTTSARMPMRRLSEGWLDRNEIECPLHAGRFDIKTGAATAPPCVDPIKTYRCG